MQRTLKLLLATLTIVSCQLALAMSVTLADYPRYGTQLSPDYQARMRAAAVAVVTLLASGASVDISVFGHADFDANKALEVSVSIERARSAEAFMRQAITDEAARTGQSEKLSQLRLDSAGLGTSRPVNPHPTGEEERKANRRIEIVWSIAPAPAPGPAEPSLQRCLRAQPLVTVAGTRRRMGCVCNLLQSNPTSGDGYYDYRAKLEVPGSAGWPSLSADEWAAVMGSFIRHFKGEIQRASNSSASDADFARSLEFLDDSVGRSIGDFSAQTNAGAAMGLLDRAILGNIQGLMANPAHTYSCYAGYSRRRHAE